MGLVLGTVQGFGVWISPRVTPMTLSQHCLMLLPAYEVPGRDHGNPNLRVSGEYGNTMWGLLLVRGPLGEHTGNDWMAPATVGPQI